MNLEDIARKHSQFIGTIEKEIELGEEFEFKKVKDRKKARDIAYSNVEDCFDYYSNKKLKESIDKIKKIINY